ncbi:MAG: enoyl-CoA hydratase/isomerase family protein [Burkholderiaceae bacterium]
MDDGPIRHLVLNRPAKLNAIETAQHERVIDALKEAESDERVRLVAFSGNGSSFCAGDDLKAIGSDFRNPLGWPERYLRRHMVDLDIGIGPMLLQEVTSAIRRFPKPTAALMHGYAIGAGYDYALSCDLRVVTDDCRFGDPRIHRALWSAEGWSYKLPRAVPLGFAARIAYLGELLSGEQAMEIGIAHALLPAGTPVREGARDLLLRVAGFDETAYRMTKQALLDGLDLPYEAASRRL